MMTRQNKYVDKKVILCNRCKGSGKTEAEECEFCKGSGRRLLVITTETTPYEPEVVE